MQYGHGIRTMSSFLCLNLHKSEYQRVQYRERQGFLWARNQKVFRDQTV